MAGGVAELCADTLDVYGDASLSVTDPFHRVAGEAQVVRGGSWRSASRELRTSSRISPSIPSDAVGVRCAKDAEPTSSVPPADATAPGLPRAETSAAPAAEGGGRARADESLSCFTVREETYLKSGPEPEAPIATRVRLGDLALRVPDLGFGRAVGRYSRAPASTRSRSIRVRLPSWSRAA